MHRSSPPLLVAAALLLGCQGSGSELPPDSTILVELDKRNESELIRYYFGGLVGPDASDPFAAGIVSVVDGAFHVDLRLLASHDSAAAAALLGAARDDRVDWDGFVSFVEQSFTRARLPWPDLAALRADAGYLTMPSEWLRFSVRGVMTSAVRTVHVPRLAVRQALDGLVGSGRGEGLVYQAGTVVVGEHHDADTGQLIEVSVMRRRADGFWDFFVYDGSGSITNKTQARPRSLQSPVQCVGCHLGSKLYEPERSYPGLAADGPHGPRWLRTENDLEVDREVVVLLDEHRRRSDGLLGLYATIFVSELLSDRSRGDLSESDRQLLVRLGL